MPGIAKIIQPPDESVLIGRALRSYGRPVEGWRNATIRQFLDMEYVVLDANPESHIVYRISNDGQLRRLHEKPPPEILDGES